MLFFENSPENRPYAASSNSINGSFTGAGMPVNKQESTGETTPVTKPHTGPSRGRVLAEDVEAAEFVPGFDRSSVDGYALAAADTFGCGEDVYKRQ